MKLLIGEISSPKAIVVCRYIKMNYPDAEVISYDYKSFTNKIRTKYSDKHYVISQDDKITGLSHLVEKESIDIFIPVMSSEIEELLSQREKFGHSLDYTGSLEAYRTLHYKNNLMELASSLNVRIPKTYNTIAEAARPYIIKPVNASSAKGVRYILNEREHLKAMNEFVPGDFVIQEYIKGFGAGYSSFCRNGKIITGYGHRRLAEYPVTGGSSVYRCAYSSNEMYEINKKILEEVNWSGFCMTEFKIKSNNEAYLIEVNPRIWGSIYQGLTEGINYFEPLLGKTVNNRFNRKKCNTYLSPLIYSALLKYLLMGVLSPIFKFFTDFHKSTDVSLFSDFNGFLSIIVKKIKLKRHI
jgi:predicted ATP-grasp superfamily ATP-dependent carboligase